jgi:1-acyl-sn-glycerol-3-phosphate acyltransferase
MWLNVLNTRCLGSVFGVYWRLGMRGAVRAIPKRGPLIVAANHSSFLDPWFIAMRFPRTLRFLITDKWYYKNALWKELFRAYGAIPMRAGDPLGTIDIVCRNLDNGDAIVVFPEGRITYDGRMQRFRSGVARIAARSGVAVLPVGVRGAFRSLPRHRRFPRPTRVTVHVSEPIRFEGDAGRRKPALEEIRAFNETLFEKISRLTGQSGGVPDGQPRA